MKNIIKKIWTTSPRDIYQKAYKIFKPSIKNTPINLTVKSGIIKNALLTVFDQNSKAGIAMGKGQYESYLIDELLKRVNVKDKTIWDVGAYIGYHSLGFAKIAGKNGQVIAFEPNPNNFELLSENIKNNLDIGAKIIGVTEALSNINSQGKMKISEDKYKSSSTGGYLDNVTPPLEEHHYTGFTEIKIKTTTIDEIIKTKELPIPDIIKIDVEGGEYNVILGAREILQKKKPVLIIEVHSIPQMFYLQKELFKYGYTMEIIDEASTTITKNIIAI